MSSSVCRECGQPFEAKRTTRQFCGPACRSGFNNRKATRGAQLYDLVMSMRFVRAEAKDALFLLCRAAARFKAEDERDRAGRPSWDDVETVRARNPSLLSTVVGRNVAGAPRPGAGRVQ